MTHTRGAYSPAANLRYPLTMRRRASGPLIKVDASFSPANYRRRIYGVIPLSRLARNVCKCMCAYVNGSPEMATDERWQPTRAQLFRATVTSSGRDVIPGWEAGFIAPGPGNTKVDSRPSCRKQTDGRFMIYLCTRRGLYTGASRSHSDEEL